MGPLSLAIGTASVLAGVTWAQARRLGARARAWRAAAESCGLEDVEELRAFGVTTRLRGRAGRLVVEIDTGRGERMAGSTRVQVTGTAAVAMRAEGPETAIKKSMARITEHEVGDPSFDSAVYLEGPPDVLQALLDAPTRLSVRRLVKGVLGDESTGAMFSAMARIQPGRIRLHMGEGAPGFARRELKAALRAVLDLARRLERPADVVGRLARNAREDLLPEVRRRNLVLLRREFPGAEATTEALREACGDQDDEVRLYAALELGQEAEPVLRALARASASDSCASRAIERLGRRLSADEAMELLALALAQRRLPVAVACITVLAGRGGAATVSALSRVLALEQEPPAAAAARALGHEGLEGAEDALLQHGLVHPHPAVRVAAAAALGRVGTARAVLPLQERVAHLPGDAQRTVREAVAAIQSRLRGAAPGQLSVSDGSAGAVSLSLEGGEVSLEPRP